MSYGPAGRSRDNLTLMESNIVTRGRYGSLNFGGREGLHLSSYQIQDEVGYRPAPQTKHTLRGNGLSIDKWMVPKKKKPTFLLKYSYPYPRRMFKLAKLGWVICDETWLVFRSKFCFLKR
jgi:hypothetical protein